MAQKLDYLMHVNGDYEAVKARIYGTTENCFVAQVSGGIFNGCEIDQEQLDTAIRILEGVRSAAQQAHQCA